MAILSPHSFPTMEPQHPIRLVICDDHRIVIDGLQRLLDDVPWVETIGTATGGEELLELLSHLSMDLLILDLNMPGMDGGTTMMHVRNRWPGIKVLILTMDDSPAVIKEVIKAGADGYLLKACGREELLHALREVHAGRRHIPEDVTEAMLAQQRVREQTAGRLATLSRREREVLAALAEGLTNKEIGEQLFISHRTVDTHRTNLMKKLGVHNLVELVRIAYEEGMVR